jgi:hypothetical protein
MAGMHLAHPNQAEIGEIRLAIRIPLGERSQLRQVLSAVECERYQPLPYHREGEGNAPEVEGGLGQDGLTRQERLDESFGNADRPLMVLVVPVGESDQEARIGDALQGRENPLREDRSFAPLTAPARAMNRRLPEPARALSSCSRMMRLRESPVRAETSSSHSASCLVRRTVVV